MRTIPALQRAIRRVCNSAMHLLSTVAFPGFVLMLTSVLFGQQQTQSTHWQPPSTATLCGTSPAVLSPQQTDGFDRLSTLPSRSRTNYAGEIQGIPEFTFPSNLAPQFGVLPGTFPPIQTDPVLGTSPLISRAGGKYRAQSPHPERAVASLGGTSVDLITGSPLHREIDLELPFGGAIYRHVRTYSEPWSSLWHEEEAVRTGAHTNFTRFLPRSGGVADEMLWDWHGQGWMMSENPIP